LQRTCGCCGSAVEGQEDAVGLVVVAGGVEADAVFGAGREYRVGESDLPVVENDDGNVLERHEGVSSCSMASEKCSRRSRAGREIMTLRQVRRVSGGAR
jgi:hypothetical protein